MQGAVVLWLMGGHIGSRGMAGAVGLGLQGGHVGSRGMAGAVVPKLLPAMLVPRAWRELWVWGCHRS